MPVPPCGCPNMRCSPSPGTTRTLAKRIRRLTILDEEPLLKQCSPRLQDITGRRATDVVDETHANQPEPVRGSRGRCAGRHPQYQKEHINDYLIQ
jgi:hypothetical protein